MGGAQTRGLRGAELIFAKRMLPHVMGGKSFEEAAIAVLEDDARIFITLFDRSGNIFFPTADERGRSHRTRIGKGDVIASELSHIVFSALSKATGAA